MISSGYRGPRASRARGAATLLDSSLRYNPPCMSDNQLPTVSIESDQPIKTSYEDTFGRRQFADRIAEIISTRTDPSSLVVSVNAPWGDGKTSVLNMIEENLRESSTIILNF